jgi:hypothetical protein
MKLSPQIKKYLNANVYLTNFLLIPIIFISIQIRRDITRLHNADQNNIYFRTYRMFWLILACYTGIVFIFSTIHHIFMFSNVSNKIGRKLLDIDLYTAPILGVVMVTLNIFYIIILTKKQTHHSILYITSTLYTIFGVTIFIFKHTFMHGFYKRDDALSVIKWLEGHTLFHYIVYMGLTLLVYLYLVDNKLIYETLLKIKG